MSQHIMVSSPLWDLWPDIASRPKVDVLFLFWFSSCASFRNQPFGFNSGADHGRLSLVLFALLPGICLPSHCVATTSSTSPPPQVFIFAYSSHLSDWCAQCSCPKYLYSFRVLICQIGAPCAPVPSAYIHLEFWSLRLVRSVLLSQVLIFV
jgi:hypothetical protein